MSIVDSDGVYRVCDKCPDPWGCSRRVFPILCIRASRQREKLPPYGDSEESGLSHSTSRYSQQTQRFILIRERW